MIGYIYNNPKLAYEEDGFWSFDDRKPHAYWCVLAQLKGWKYTTDFAKDNSVLLAPVWFDVMDNLPESVIDICSCQLSDNLLNITVGIGRCIHRPISDLTTEPVVLLNPNKAKEAYRIFARSIRRTEE